MGYTYVMSDIHGMAHLLKQMLEEIRFSDGDQLYILGDMIDRGPDPAGVIDLVSQSRNITALRGNHEDSFAEWYENVESPRSGETTRTPLQSGMRMWKTRWKTATIIIRMMF